MNRAGGALRVARGALASVSTLVQLQPPASRGNKIYERRYLARVLVTPRRSASAPLSPSGTESVPAQGNRGPTPDPRT